MAGSVDTAATFAAGNKHSFTAQTEANNPINVSQLANKVARKREIIVNLFAGTPQPTELD